MKCNILLTAKTKLWFINYQEWRCCCCISSTMQCWDNKQCSSQSWTAWNCIQTTQEISYGCDLMYLYHLLLNNHIPVHPQMRSVPDLWHSGWFCRSSWSPRWWHWALRGPETPARSPEPELELLWWDVSLVPGPLARTYRPKLMVSMLPLNIVALDNKLKVCLAKKKLYRTDPHLCCFWILIVVRLQSQQSFVFYCQNSN